MQSSAVKQPEAALIGMGFGSSQPATMALTVDLLSLDERGMGISTQFLGFDSGISGGSFALVAIAKMPGKKKGCLM